MTVLKEYSGLNIVFDNGLFYAITKANNIILTRKHNTFSALWTEFRTISTALTELGLI